MDNIFTERLWRTVKYQEAYLHDYESPREARNGISRFLKKYNTYRPHQALRNLTPAEVYSGNYTVNNFLILLFNRPPQRLWITTF
jgi:putative transposase